MKSLQCPKCKIPLDLSLASNGRVACGGCNTFFKLPENVLEQTEVPMAPGAVDQPAASNFSSPPLDDLGSVFDDDLSLAPESPKAYPPSSPLQIQTETPAPKSDNRKLLFVASGIIVGVLMLLGLVVWMVSGNDDGGTAITEADRPAEPVPADDIAQEDDEPGGGGVIDLSDLNALDMLDTSEPEPEQVIQVTEATNTYGWPTEVRLVSIAGGQIGTIDGVLQTELSDTGLASSRLTLPVPSGVHQIRTATGKERRKVESSGFAKYYRTQRNRFTGAEGLDLQKLSRQLATTSGVITDPIVSHLIGDAYWQQGEHEAAKRFWELTIRIAPSFAPSHLNLAFAALEANEITVAQREFHLASVLNLQDTFGISAHLGRLRRQLPILSDAKHRYSESDYFPTVEMGDVATRVIEFYQTLRDMADAQSDRAACLNNIGVYLMEKQKSPDLAFSYFVQAQQELAPDQLNKHRQLADTILNNVVRSARAAGFAETELFRTIQASR